jgi:ABC-type multidrug transport system fused ATPase/permease subunit
MSSSVETLAGISADPESKSRAPRRVGRRRPKGERPLSHIIRGTLFVVGPDRWRIVVAGLAAFLAGILEVAFLYLIASIAVSMTDEEKTVHVSFGPISFDQTPGVTCLIAAGLLALLLFSALPRARILASLSERAAKRLRGRVADSYVSSSVTFRATLPEGHFEQLIGEFCIRSEQLLLQATVFITGLTSLIVILAGAVVVTPVGSLGAIAALGLTMCLLSPLARSVKKHAKGMARKNQEVVRQAAQISRMREEIATFDVAPAAVGTMATDIESAASLLEKVRFEAQLVPVLYQYSALGAVLALIGVLIVVDSGGAAGVAPLVLLLIRGLMYTRQLVMAERQAIEMAPYTEALEKEFAAFDEHRMSRDGSEPEHFEGLYLSDVKFAYTEDEPVLVDVNLAIDPGEMIGLVGPSGSGKSTLSQLILRLRPPTEGRVLAGGTSIWDIAPASWAQLTALVPQDCGLVLGTIADNIRFFRTGHSEEQVRAAARAAHLDPEIVAMPDGYATIVGPGARSLSGGQRQRLAIARALLGRPQLLVLDEPTSALDSRSETLIGDTLAELKGSITIILIAHRPATLELCDRTLRVREGIVEEANPVSAGPHL